jgi:DNA gyrase inhibitor GyrI
MKLKITKKLIIYTSLFIILILIAMSGSLMSQVNEPKHTLIFSEENIEIREYTPILVAQVSVEGERKSAISKGFRILADYIFGNNEGREKISMTAPVIQQEGEKISMTAPVIQQESLDNLHWHVRFVMPSEYTIEKLPLPKNKQIEMLSIPSKRYAVIRFSGFPTEKVLKKNLDTLQHYTIAKQLHGIGKPIYAFYNPPWTLPFLRRNEIMIELE